MLNRVSDVRIFGKGPESYVWRVGYGYAAAIREGAEEIPVIFLDLFPTHQVWPHRIWECSC